MHACLCVCGCLCVRVFCVYVCRPGLLGLVQMATSTSDRLGFSQGTRSSHRLQDLAAGSGTRQEPTGILPGTYQEPTRNIPGTYQAHTRNLPGPYQKPTRKLPGACQERARNLAGICQEPTRDRPETYQKHTRNQPETYQEPTRNPPETYQEPTRNLPGTYQGPTRNLPGTFQKPTRNTQNYIKNNKNMFPTLLKNRPQNQPKSSPIFPGAPLGRGLGTYLGALGKRPRFRVDFGTSGAPRQPPWGTLVGAIFALGSSLGAPKELEEAILSHLGRVLFWTLILDPKNHQKRSISRAPEA